MRSAIKGVALCGIGAGLGMLGLRAIAGPLDPPAGPVSATYKTMSEVEPRIAINSVNTPGSPSTMYRITKPGSYYLTDNIDVDSGKIGISIEATHITVDLSGFQVRGTATSLSLINVVGAGYVTVCNGTLLSSSQLGIDCPSNGPDIRVERVRVLGCSGGGIRVGNSAIIQNCQVEQGTFGIDLDTGGTVTNCIVTNSVGDGIRFGSGTIISGCVVRLAGGDGIHARAVGSGGAMIKGCCVFATTGDGIEVAQSTTVRENQVESAGLNAGSGAGVHVIGSRNTIDGNSIEDSDRGVDVDSSTNWIYRNSCSNNGVNYSIAVGNTYGAIVAGGSNANAVNGSSAPGTMGSTDPWTNLSY